MVFSLFKKTPEPSQDLVSRILSVQGISRSSAFQVIPDLLAQRKWDYIARNCSAGCEATLSRVVLLQRARGDSISALKELKECDQFLRFFENAMLRMSEAGEDGNAWVYLSNLKYLLLASLLSGNLVQAERFAQYAKNPDLISSDDSGQMSYADAFVKMLAACIEGNVEQFGDARLAYQECDERKKSRFFSTYFVYDQLMGLILEKDDERLNNWFVQQDEFFRARKSDSKTTHAGVVLDGMLELNELTFDVWSTGLACLAKKQGLKVEHSSPIIPISTFFA